MTSASLSQPGTLVHAREREWVVLPESTDDLLLVRPLGGPDEEIAGVLPALEAVEPATLGFPTSAEPVTSGRAACCATPSACACVRPRARSAASAASPSSRGHTSSCRC